MKKVIMSTLALLGVHVAFASTAVVNYDAVYTKWSEAVTVSTQVKSQLDDVNTKLSVKVDTRNALIRQANEYASTKANDEAAAKTLQTKFDTVRKSIDDLN